ncbi:flagellar protein FlgN [Desulfosoma sp.]
MTHDQQCLTDHEVEAVRIEAEHLLELLRQETRLLAEGDHAALLEILPEKEALARRLSESLRRLRRTEGRPEAATLNRTPWVDLKETLRRIEALNDANGRYIADLLLVHRELLSMMVPQTYGHAAQKALPALKGFGLSTEA